MFRTRAPLAGVVPEGPAAYQLAASPQARGVFGCLGAGTWVLERLSEGTKAPQGLLGFGALPMGQVALVSSC